jgi:hypothetical protein
MAVSRKLIESITETVLAPDCLEFLSLTLPSIYKSTIPEAIA